MSKMDYLVIFSAFWFIGFFVLCLIVTAVLLLTFDVVIFGLFLILMVAFVPALVGFAVLIIFLGLPGSDY